ncbi:MAG: glycosyltransferase [Candidatus Cloacimonetes bacterium]|nr:glycosyltransferase [Candidatus Cloacimonadota bacterium]
MDKVCIFTTVHNWNDNRIFFKEAKSLALYYKVELHAPADFEKKTIDGIEVIGLPQEKRLIKRVRIWFILWKRLLASDAKVYHFHDPELLVIGLLLSLLHKKKVVYDVHEQYRETLKNKLWLSLTTRQIAITVYDILERLGYKYLSLLVLVRRTSQQHYPGKSIKLQNFPILIEVPKTNKKKWDLVYIGGITKSRGIFELIRAIDILARKGRKVSLLVIGPIFEKEDEILWEISRRGLDDLITLKGRIPYNQAIPLLVQCRIGLAVLHPTGNYQAMYPTKIFEYMLLGLPVITSNFKLYKGIVETEQCGLTVNPYNPWELADAISVLLKNPKLRKKFTENGRRAIKEKYNWYLESELLLEQYRKLCAN